MITFLLIVHSILAVTLLGAVSHQAVTVVWPARTRDSFAARFRAVAPVGYANAVVVLYALTATLGAVIYPAYRVDVRELLEPLNQRTTIGLFELKEHFVAVGLGVLPAYWYFWHKARDEGGTRTRVALTVMVAAVTWWAFVVGHIVNNVKGFGL